ncbi:MAG: iron ABC transporter substrate-binding protein, partial [Promethearchaeota archaeon]
MKSKSIIAVFLISAAVIISGLVVINSNILNSNNRKIVDGLNRDVYVPDNPKRIVAINPGALRLVCYLNLTNEVVGVESFENTTITRPYNFAYPQLGNLPQIGPQFGGDPELIVGVSPDVIFATYMEKGDADSLQEQTGVPVVVVPYGDLFTYIDDFYKSLRIIADVMNVQNRAEQLINFINNTIIDLSSRTNAIENRSSVYIGGIGYHGLHGLSSTEPKYPPFEFIHANNVAGNLSVGHAFVDDEQVIAWDPEYLFIDGGGYSLAIEDIKNGTALWSSLNAIKNNKTYVVLPYNYYTTNIETELLNAYYIGTIIYP